MNSANLKELKELLQFGTALQSGIIETLEDDKINFWDILNFKDLPKTIKPAFDNIGNPLERYKALTSAEKEELHTEIFKNIGHVLPDQMEALVGRTLKVVCDLIEIAKEWKKIRTAHTA